jgi:hypothetical protein
LVVLLRFTGKSTGFFMQMAAAMPHEDPFHINLPPAPAKNLIFILLNIRSDLA